MKKITKILDSVMSTLKRTCVAKAIAVFAVATIAMNSFAQEETITGVKDLAGKDSTYINSHLTTDGNYPVDMSKMFFLYNEATGKFLNIGGYWGTHVALADYGKPLWVVSGEREICLNPDALPHKREFQTNKVLLFTHNMATTLSEDQGPYVGWPQATKNNPAEDIGVFSDRKNTATDIYGWELEFTGNDMKTCKLKTKKTYEVLLWEHYCWSDDVYLCGVPASVDPNRSCEAYSDADIKSKGLTGYDTWRIMTYEDIYNLQNKNTENMTKSIDLSFMLKCPGFQRGDNDIANWKTYNFATKQYNENNAGFASFGLSKYYSKAANWEEKNIVKGLSETAYTFDGGSYDNTKKGTEAYWRHLGKFFCASITNHRGIVYQDVTVKLAGTYVVECKGFSTTDKAALVAGVLNPNYGTNNEPMMLGGVLNRTTLSQTSNMTADEQTRLHIGEMNMDYAGKAFFDSSKFTNSVVVVVPKEAMANGTATIRLGVMVGNGQDDKNVEGDEWTVFDDFRLLFASKSTVEDLILDENRDNLDYLVNTKTTYKNRTLHLKKDLKADCWNSFILPVDLTKEQVRKAFGANTRLAKLSKLTETAIEFESVKMETMENGAQAMAAYVPYIIFPSGSNEGITQPAYTATLETKDGGIKQVKIEANHYTIQNVTVPTDTDGANIWQFSKDGHWMVKGNTVDGNGSMEAWGTFARTFGTGTQGDDGKWTITDKGNIIAGRDDLKGCYFFDNGKMYHSTTRARGLRGFSCWFKPTTNNSTSPNAQLTIDGVTQSGTTGIEDILADYEQPVSRFANGIYNLNGQLVKQGNSTAGLPSGLYIVNGKKCIVR